MTWDVWVLTILILVSTVIVVGALIEDIRANASYDRELRANREAGRLVSGHGRHRRAS